MENRTMGKGLASLLNVNEISVSDEGSPVDIDLILIDPNPFQPRLHFDEQALAELAESIKKHGVLQPVVLRKTDYDRYELIAGERRFRASKLAGKKTVPAIIRDVTDIECLELAVIENIQREDIGPIETAMAYRRLIDEFGYTQEALSAVVGKSRSSIANLLRLLQLPKPVLEMLNRKYISEGHARTILSVSAENRVPFAEKIVNESLTVRDAEELARIINNPLGDMSEAEEPEPEKEPAKTVSRETAELKKEGDLLSRVLNAKVKVVKRKTRGHILVEFKNDEDLERIISFIKGENK